MKKNKNKKKDNKFEQAIREAKKVSVEFRETIEDGFQILIIPNVMSNGIAYYFDEYKKDILEEVDAIIEGASKTKESSLTRLIEGTFMNEKKEVVLCIDALFDEVDKTAIAKAVDVYDKYYSKALTRAEQERARVEEIVKHFD